MIEVLKTGILLDDTDRIRRIDRSNMLSFCVDASKHYAEAARLARTFSVDYPKPRAIIVAGMGGSAIGGTPERLGQRQNGCSNRDLQRVFAAGICRQEHFGLCCELFWGD